MIRRPITSRSAAEANALEFLNSKRGDGETRRLYSDGRFYSDRGRRVVKAREKRDAQYRYEKRQQRNARKGRR